MKDMLLQLYVKVQSLLAAEEGQDLVEYALLAAMLSLAAVAILPGLGTQIKDTFTQIQTALTTANAQ